MRRLLLAGGLDASAALHSQLDGALAIDAVDGIESRSDLMLLLYRFSVFKEGVHHVTLIHDPRCDDPGLLVPESIPEKLFCSVNSTGDNRPLLCCRSVE